VQQPMDGFPHNRHRVQARLTILLALGSAALLCLLAPAGARAVIHPAAVLDGPANDIIDVDGTAMAPDGSGGIVYRKQVAGVAHVFAIQFVNGHWGSPIQVDGANPYGASMPTIAAGNGGRLLVVWVQPRNVNSQGTTLYELVGASLQPGASTFGAAIIIDPSVGEPFSGDISAVDPSLAMNPSSGQAYVVYRVITDDCNNLVGDPPNSSCPPGGSADELIDVRVARFNYLTWTSLGAINRASQIPMRDPTAGNAPSIGIDLNGNAVVAWQEPDSGGVARIWVRRLFGTVLGNVLEASPETAGGRPITSDAEAPTVAVSPYGEARIAFRVDGAPGSAVPATQLFLNSISSALGLNAAKLGGAVAVAGATQSGLGAPSAAIDQKGDFRLAWTQGGSARELAGTTQTIGAQLGIGPAAAPQEMTSINPAGGGTGAWMASSAGLPAVAVREDYAQGAFQLAQLAGNVSGPIAGLSLAGSGQGDALLGWTQGAIGQAEVVGDFVQAPPAPFSVDAASGWVRGRSAAITWESSLDAQAGVTYVVYVDGKPRLKGLTGLAARLSSVSLGDGVHHLQVLATDASGQQTMSSERALKVDANPPTVSLSRVDHQRGVRVTVSDKASGVDAAATRISFGDGQHLDKHARGSHEYARAGLYTIRVTVRDKVGNHAIVHLRARVR
jgi:hypothetical protein